MTRQVVVTIPDGISNIQLEQLLISALRSYPLIELNDINRITVIDKVQKDQDNFNLD